MVGKAKCPVSELVYDIYLFTVRTSRQGSCNQRVGCLLCSMAIYDLQDGSVDQRMVRGPGPSLVVVSMAIELKYAKTPHRYIQILICTYMILDRKIERR